MPTWRIRLSMVADQAVRVWPATLGLALTVLLFTWTLGTPRYGAPDEIAHTTKAFGTAHRQTIGAPDPDHGSVVRIFTVPKGLTTGEPCFAFHSDINASCATSVRDSTLVGYGTSAGTYPPEWYAIVGGITRLTGTDQSAMSYRVITTLIGAALLVVALTLMRRAGGRRAALALIALNPMTVFVVASTNPSSTELAGMLLLWGYVAVLLTSQRPATRRQLLLAFTIAAGVVVIRPVALPWVLVALATLVFLERRQLAADVQATARLLAVSSWPLVIAVVASTAWSRYAGVGITDDRFLVSEPTTTMIRQSLGRTSDMFHQAFGILGWLDANPPTWTYGLWIVCLVLVVSIVAFAGDRRRRLVVAGIGVIWVAYPVVFAVAAKTPFVWQGRYNLPLLGGVVVCAMLAARSTAAVQVDSILRFCTAAWVVIEVAAFYQTMRRFMVGAGGSLLLRGGWHPPINVWLLFAANWLAALTVAWLLLQPVPSVSSPPGCLETLG